MTPPIKSWIGPFLTRHRLRFDCADWPQPGTEANRQNVLLWLAALNAHLVTEAEAEAASLALGTVPPQFRIDHIPALIGMVVKLRQHERDKQEGRSAPFTRGHEQPPLPPLPGFKSWQEWVKKGCPYFELEDAPTERAQKPAAGPVVLPTPDPQPAGASTDCRLPCEGIVPPGQGSRQSGAKNISFSPGQGPKGPPEPYRVFPPGVSSSNP
jgi:hypothetical protein